MKKIFIIISLLILSISFIKEAKVKGEEVTIPTNSIRLRVIANSDSEEDQSTKIKISMKVHEIVNELLEKATTKEEARNLIKNNINQINKKIEEQLQKMNYKGTYRLTYGNTFFPEKKYNGVIYEKGFYDSILITLGKGEGKNWWCVLFPPLCLMEAEENNVDEVEYKFFVKELINKYF